MNDSFFAFDKSAKAILKNFLLISSLFVFSVAGCASAPKSAIGEQISRSPDWAEPVALDGVPNLHKINDNVYRSAQPTPEGIQNLEKIGIKTIINLRDFHDDKDEAKGIAVKRVDIPMLAWGVKDEEVVQALKQLGNKSEGPYLIHCMHGADRTGVVSAMYRVVYDNWDKKRAIDEMRNGGFGFHEVWKNIVEYVEKVDVNAIKLSVGK